MNGMRRKLLFGVIGIILAIAAACSNPFFPEKKDNSGVEVPVISIHPKDAEYITGDEADALTVDVSAGDGGELSYQWYSSEEDSSDGGTPIPDATEASYIPPADDEGTVYYYIEVTNTLKGKKATAASDAAKVTVYDVGGAEIIRSVNVTVTAPIKGSAPNTTASGGAGYTCDDVLWNPDDDPFLGNMIYTATVTLMADNGYAFAPKLLPVTINKHAAEISAYTVFTVTLSITFDATSDKTITDISIDTHPAKLEYTHGEALDLSGLVVTLTYDDAASEDVEFAYFGTNISTDPADGEALSYTDHNGRPVVVSYGGLTANAQNLTVNKAVVSSITFPEAGTVNYGAVLSSSILTGGSDGGSFAWVDGAIIPTVDNSGYDAVFTPDDTVNYDYSGVSGWNSGTGKVVRNVSITVNPALITNAAVTITGPMKGDIPSTTATADGEGYNCGAVSWSPVHNPFQGNTKYTATVTLTAKENYTFAVDLDATINNDDAAVANNTTAAVTLSLEFDTTLDKTVSGISVKTQPALSYTHGDTLDLSGLVVTLAFDNSTSEDIALANFGTNISTHPANGAVLHHLTNNNQPVTVHYGELTANTNNLTVNTRALTVTGAAHTRQYDGTTTATGVSVTLDGIVNNEDVSAGTVTAVYTSAAAGTRTINITVVTLTGQAAENYTVTPVNNITVTGGGITKADPSITWPAGLTATYGQILSNILLTSYANSVTGIFTWTTPAASVGAGTQSHIMTFTPTDTANYNTLTQNVSITVNKANITDAAVVITEPVKGVVPAATAATTDTDYTCGTVSWNPNDNLFLGGTVYTATVTLTADSNYTFTNLSSATINGENAAVSNNTGTAVTLSYTFSETDTRAVTGIALKTQPDKLIYTHGDPLDLAGLVVTLIHDDTTTEDVTDADFTAKNITTNPAHGNHLVHAAHNGQPVTITYGDLTPITTNTLTVNKANPTVTWPTGLTATYGQTLSNISLSGKGTSTPAGTFTWTTPSTSVGNVGTRSFSMTFTPTDTANYNTPTQNVSITVSKANPTVTWPTGLTANYGQTLSNISLPGNGTGTPAGTFTWTTPTTSVGAPGTRSFSMTFTPTDTANYNTLTQNVSITVSKANPTVTWPTGLTAAYGQTLSNISLSGKGTSTPAGTFTWSTPSTSVGALGTKSFSMTFTPTDTTNYNTLTQNVSITVNKAIPTVTWPTGLTAMYGQILANISLPGNGTSTPAGKFTWTTPSTSVGSAGTRSHGMTFTPTDTTNYNTLTQNVSITVNKANPTVTWPTGLTAMYGQTLANISLPGNGTSTSGGQFTWTTPSTSVGSAGTRSHGMTFTPTDTTNYNTLTQNVSIIVNQAMPTVTWPTNLTAALGQTLSNISLPGNGTSTPAGTFRWTTPSTSVGALGTRSFSMTFTPNDTANYNTLTQSVNVTVGYQVSFNTNGGTSISNQTIAREEATVSRPSNPTRSGYVFDYWYLNAGLTTPYNFSTVVNNSITLHAKWISNTDINAMSNKDMVWVAGGSFQMGQNGNGSSNNVTPVHTVTLSGFYIGKYEVTQAQYQAVIGTNPSGFTSGTDVGETVNRRPVERVSWYETLIFCNKLSMSEGLSPAYRINGSTDPSSWGSAPARDNEPAWDAVQIVSGSNGYRLPTEAQWEYAAKGGPSAANPYMIYSGSNNANTVAWYSGKTGTSNNSWTHEVGKLASNELGIYDMSGNVSEWCWDSYGSYTSGAQTDPVGPSSHNQVVHRGGNYSYSDTYLRSTYRLNTSPYYRDNYIGFRIMRPAQ